MLMIFLILQWSCGTVPEGPIRQLCKYGKRSWLIFVARENISPICILPWATDSGQDYGRRSSFRIDLVNLSLAKAG